MKRLFFEKGLLLALMIAAMAVSCAEAPRMELKSAQPPVQADAKAPWVTVELCFLSSDVANSNALMTTETRQIKPEEGKPLERAALEELLKGPTTPQSKNIVPKGCGILSMEREEGDLLVVLSQVEEKLGAADEAMLKNMIVLTLTRLPGIERVGVYFGEVKRDDSGRPVGVISQRDIVSEDITRKVGQKTITIYLPNAEHSALLPRKISIQTSINESVEKTAVDELFKNTAYNGFSQTVFNSNAKLVSSFVEGDVFFLNFSEPIIKEQTSYEEAYLSVYALINTISDLQPIKNIQILIKGKTNTESPYGELFKEPYLTKNEEIILS